jgi:hypothetical protein
MSERPTKSFLYALPMIRTVIATLLLASCNPPRADHDASPIEQDAAMDAAEPLIDAMPTPGCGNGVAEPGEICLAAPIVVPVQNQPYEVHVSELDADALPDLLVVAFGEVRALRQAPSGFEPLASLTMVDVSNAGAVEISATGAPAIVTTFQTPTQAVAVFGIENGQMVERQHLPIPDLVGSGAVIGTDFDSDGDVDVVSGSNYVLRNDGGTLVYAGPGVGQSSFVLADMDSDGLPDAIRTGGSTAYVWVEVMRGVGDGTFAAPVMSQGLPCMHSISIASCQFTAQAATDLDSDDLLDVVAVGGSPLEGQDLGVQAFLGQPGLGLSSAGGDIATDELAAARPIDIDDDGLMDIAALNWRGDAIEIYRGMGGGVLRHATSISTAPLGRQPIALAVADLNGDGRDDIVTANTLSDNLSIFYANP